MERQSCDARAAFRQVKTAPRIGQARSVTLHGAWARAGAPPDLRPASRGRTRRHGKSFDLWVHSSLSGGALVWDRHDRLFGYGPVDRLSDKLTSLGFIEGHPEIPVPHQHYYRAELDSLAKGVMAAFEWSYATLRPEDEQ